MQRYFLLLLVITSVNSSPIVNSTETADQQIKTEDTTSVPNSSSATESSTIVSKYSLPTDIPTCNEQDDNINDCLRETIDLMIRRYKDGSQELNIPTLDPFKLNRTSFQYKNGPVSGKILMKNGLIYGLSESDTERLDLKHKGEKIFVKMVSKIPKLVIMGNYKAEMLFNNVSVKPRGTFNVTITKLEIDQLAEGNLYEKEGHRFVHLSKFDAQPKIGALYFNATGIFPDPTLNEFVVNVANQYWRDVYRIMLPETKEYWAPLLLRVANEALSSVPYDAVVKKK